MMKRVGLMLALMGALNVAPRASHASQDKPTAAEVDAIKALMVQTTDAFNRHDAKAWARFCTADAQLVTVRGESMKGVAEGDVPLRVERT